MLTQKGQARRKLLTTSMQSALLYYPLVRMFRDSEALAQTAAPLCGIFASIPTGYRGNFWPGGGTGPIQNFSPVLKPIEELGLKEDFLLLDGLNFHGSTNHNGGLTQTFAGWGGAGLRPGTGTAFGGRIDGQTMDQMMDRPYSMDQVLADKWGTQSVNLGVATQAVQFKEPLSWKMGGNPNKSEDNPKVTFDRYFAKFSPPDGGSTAQAEAAKKIRLAEKRVIDFLRADIKRIENNLSSEDKLAFQSHVAAIDDINAEIDKTINTPPKPEEQNLACKTSDLGSKFGGTNGQWFLDENSLARVFQLERALIVQILACGIARIAIWQIGGGHCYSQLRAEGVTQKNTDHHGLTHEGGAQFEDVQRGHIREIGKLAQDLKNAKIGGKSMLDNTLIFTGSDGGDTGHNGQRIPSFFLGSLGGKFKSGRQIKFEGKGYNHALITMAHLLGETSINQIGNTRMNGPLPEVLKG